ncbi:MAG: EAL domain-containing protein [Nocardioides sp.]
MQTWREHAVAQPTALDRYRLLLVIVAVGVLIGAGAHASPDDLPGVFSLVLIVAAPVAGRLVAPRVPGVYSVLSGVALADAAARDATADPTLLLLWSMVVIAAHALFLRPIRAALASAATAIIAGSLLLITEFRIDLGVRPVGQMLIGLALYLVTLSVLALPVGLLTRGWADRGAVVRRNLGWLARGATYAGIAVGLLTFTHAEAHTVPTTVAALLPILAGAACWQTLRMVTLRRASRALTEAAVTTPWPSGAVLETLVGLVGAHVRSSRVAILDAPTDGSLWAPLDHERYLVVERLAGDFGFTRSDAHLIAGLASMARGSLVYADRERQLRHQALTDPLTGLWSYQHWLEMLLTATSGGADEAHQVGLVFLDCDGFKQINNRYGHLEADLILATIGDRLRALGAEIGWCFARFGGDEFTGWMRAEGDAAAFEKRCEELADVLAEPITVGQHSVTVTASIGRALARRPGAGVARDTVEDLVESAEIDMRRRKLRKPGAILTQHSDRDVVQRMLAAGEIAVAYQPLITLADREVWGCEALLRGHTASLGLIPPPVLVESASQARLLDAVTGEVMQQAITVAEQARTVCGRPITLTLNLEVEQFHDASELLDRLVARVDATGVPVLLELAEREPMPWTRERDRLADELATHGIGVGLDDLGSGESRLTLIGARHWDLVKLDRDLLLENHRGQGPIVLRHLMGILDVYQLGNTLLEGIETAEQEQIARDLGVRYGQGNGYGAAMGGADLLALLARGALRRPAAASMRSK